jgi:aminopeptidase N
LFGESSLSTRRLPFAISGAVPHYAPDRPFKIEHIRLEITVDPRSKTLVGRAGQSIRVVASKQKWLKLDQVGLEVDEVSVDGIAAKFSVEGQSLLIDLQTERRVGSLLEVSVSYRAPHPKRGIYFTGPDAGDPQKPYQVWTQGQDEDSRHWFPTLDYPNQKATSEIIAHVPSGFTAVSNGALISKREKPDSVEFHYRIGVPHVTYLITLVVAEFSEWSDSGPRGLPVQYFVQKGREEDGKRAFRNTPKMIEEFEKKTGIPYPYEKYSQAAVQDFIFGGMENTSATTQTDLTLHDARASIDFSSDPLVAHELAHQWFGDLVTCRDWSHGWLNEGFATFMERVWVECNPGSGGGFEEAKYYSYQDLKEYLADDQSRYRRPIICNTYIEPIDLFDTHLYQKGGLVIHLIRSILGEDEFWKSIHTYLNRHQGQSVETLDLVRAIEDSTGRNLRQFADEWLLSGGHPEFEVAYQWHEERKLAEWTIEQKQTGGAPWVTKEGVTTRLFHLPVCLEMTLEDGTQVSEKIELGEARERVFLAVPSKPVRVRFDPHFCIPKTMKFPRPKELLLNQLLKDPDCMGRIEAAQELGRIADPSIVKALGQAALSDPFWGVQAEVASVLAEVRTELARDQLIAALSARHPKARRAIVVALGTYSDEKVAQVLSKYSLSDESYFVEADAIYAWSQSRFKYLALQPLSRNPDLLREEESKVLTEVENFLMSRLSQPSYRDVIRVSAIQGISRVPGVGSGERPQLLQTLISLTRPGHSGDVRSAAVRALGFVLRSARVPEKMQIIGILSRLSDEDNFRLRAQMVVSLEGSGCSEAIPILERIGELDSDGRVKRAAHVAVDSLIVAQKSPDSIQQLKSTLEKLEEDYKKFRSKVEEKLVGV